MEIKDETIIRDLIRDEEEAIVGYEKAMATVKNQELVKVLKDIRDEEVIHIGELKALLAKLGIDDESLIMQGAEEAAEKLMEAVKELCDIYKE